MIDSSPNKIAEALRRYHNALQVFDEKLKQQSENITTSDLNELHDIIKQANQALRSVNKLSATKSPSDKLAQKTAQAIREFRTNLAQKKVMIEMAAQQVLHPVVYELEVSEKLLEEEAKRDYNTVSEIEGGGLDDPSR
ncbi:MAG: hypothetical protein ACSNEK_05020 [Parachlamydiaceae bacterium]